MFKCVLISLLKIKSFVSLKNECLVFLDEVTFQEGSQVLQNFKGDGGGWSDRFIIFLERLGKKG